MSLFRLGTAVVLLPLLPVLAAQDQRPWPWGWGPDAEPEPEPVENNVDRVREKRQRQRRQMAYDALPVLEHDD